MTQSNAAGNIIAAQTVDAWRTQATEGTFTASHFLFSDGDTLPALHLEAPDVENLRESSARELRLNVD